MKPNIQTLIVGLLGNWTQSKFDISSGLKLFVYGNARPDNSIEPNPSILWGLFYPPFTTEGLTKTVFLVANVKIAQSLVTAGCWQAIQDFKG